MTKYTTQCIRQKVQCRALTQIGKQRKNIQTGRQNFVKNSDQTKKETIRNTETVFEIYVIVFNNLTYTSKNFLVVWKENELEELLNEIIAGSFFQLEK